MCITVGEFISFTHSVASCGDVGGRQGGGREKGGREKKGKEGGKEEVREGGREKGGKEGGRK